MHVSHLFSCSLHYLQRYGVDFMVKPCVVLKAFLEFDQHSSEVGSSQIQSKIFSMLWLKKKKDSYDLCLYFKNTNFLKKKRF